MNHAQQRTYSLFTVSFTAFRRSSHHLSVRLLEPNPLAGSPQSHFHTYRLRPSPKNRSLERLVTSRGEAADVRGRRGPGQGKVGAEELALPDRVFLNSSGSRSCGEKERQNSGGSYLSRSEWSNVSRLPIAASCQCPDATGRSHGVRTNSRDRQKKKKSLKF